MDASLISSRDVCRLEGLFGICVTNPEVIFLLFQERSVSSSALLLLMENTSNSSISRATEYRNGSLDTHTIKAKTDFL